jgi:hydroxymethylpyrimidine/phosphomethylpyrimidine kinase
MTKEIVRWAVVDSKSGKVYNSYAIEKEAVTSIYNQTDCAIVKLTGTLPEPKKMKKVATYAYRYANEEVVISGVAITEDRAKKACKDRDWELIKWPYGEIIEVEE